MIRFKILDSTVHMRVSDASTINGKDGVTPHIGDNGNWYLGDVDTGNPSRGKTGPAGYTPVRGTDYWTEADQNAIVSQAVTQIQPDISEIKSDISAEQAAREQSDTSLQQEISGKLPKSPANWEPWTADEQAAARERIGASKKLGIWEDIADVNITEEAAAITVNLDANGNTFSLSDIICEIKIPAENPVKQRSVYFGLNVSINFTFSRIALTTTASYTSGVITYARIVSGRVICDGAISGPSNTRHQPYNKYAIFNGYGGIEAESFDSVSVFTYSDAFPAGTIFILKWIRT